METYSLSLFLKSDAGQILSMVILLGATLVGVVSGGILAHKLEGAPALLRFGGFALCLFGMPLCALGLAPQGEGDVEALELVDVDGQRVIFANFTWTSGGGRAPVIRHSAMRRFRVDDGERLGSLHIRGGLSARGCGDAFDDGRIRVCRDSLEVLDAVTLETILDLGDALDGRLGPDAYRVERIDGEGVLVERRDGRRETIELSALGLPAAPRQRLDLLAGRTLEGSNVEGLLRATSYPMADGTLVLHREFAFGDGAHLVSLLDAEGTTRWTTSLEPWMPGDSDDLRLLAPGARGNELAFWLLRKHVSLVEVVVDAERGTPIRSDVVF